MNTLNTSSETEHFMVDEGWGERPNNYNEEITHSFMADLGGNQNVRQTY